MPVPDPLPPIPEDDEALLSECRVDTFRAGGKGGQHQNTTETGVRLVHRPTGLRAESRTERSQLQNRRRALARLRSKLEELHRKRPERVPTRIPAAQRRKRLEEKRRRGETKRLRKRPDPGGE
ncbi:MAG: peptide chain release factor-like protein [Gemmatimonadales bacterium]|jgi:protein subunit release factor A|nr:MAG: peptide chain release factor-like protein [Gemmatimonadales bacterium]